MPSLPVKKRSSGELTIVTTVAKRVRTAPSTLQRHNSTQRPSLALSPRSNQRMPVWQEPVVGEREEERKDRSSGDSSTDATVLALTRRVRWADAVAEAGGFDCEEAESALNIVLGSAEPWVNRFPWFDERGMDDRQELVCAGEPNAAAQLEQEERERDAETAVIAAAAAAAMANAAAAVAEVSGNNAGNVLYASITGSGRNTACPAVDDSVTAMRTYQKNASTSTSCRTTCSSDHLAHRFGSLEESDTTTEVCS